MTVKESLAAINSVQTELLVMTHVKVQPSMEEMERMAKLLADAFANISDRVNAAKRELN